MSRIINNDISFNSDELMILPCVWFDGGWGFEDDDVNSHPFLKSEKFNFFEGSFAWHWHNRWDHEVQEGSKFDILNKKNESIFEQLR